MIRRLLKITGVLISVIFVLVIVLVILAELSPNARIVLPVEHRSQFDPHRYSSADGQGIFLVP